MPISREYASYLLSESEKKKPSIYEKICNTFGKIPVQFPLSPSNKINIQEKLNFVGYDIRPSSVYISAISIFLIIFSIGLVLLFLDQLVYFIFAAGGGAGLAFYFINYPTYAVKYLRIKSTSDLLLSILYMVVSLRITPNLENAIMFAATNISGPVGRDLKKTAWDLSVGKYENAEVAIEAFAGKWKQENEEFAESLDVIRTASYRPEAERVKLYDEAISLVLERNTDRMKNYATDLTNPITIVNYLGITLPVLTVVLFPVMTVFLATDIRQPLLIALYNVILPLVVYWLMTETLRSRPLSFGVVDISKHPDAHEIGKYKIGKTNIPLLPICLAVGLAVGFLGYQIIISEKQAASLMKILGGTTIVWAVALPIIIYSYFSYRKNIEIKQSIIQTETEFTEALYELGLILQTGYSVEIAIEKLLTKIKGLKIFDLFSRALENVKKFGMTLEKAIFDPQSGVLRYYPSETMKNILQIFVESLRKGSRTTAVAMVSVAGYLKSVSRVEQYLREILSEITSEMQFMLAILVPVTMAIIVALAAVMTSALVQIATLFGSFAGLNDKAPFNQPSTLGILVDVTKILPIEWFSLIVGIYMIEIIFILSTFISSLQYGDDPLEKYKLLTSGLLRGMVLFTIIGSVIFIIFSGLVKFV